VEGQVYVEGNIELRGKITGSLYCDGFMLKTKAAYYENHLLNTAVDFEALSKNFCGIPMIHQSGKLKVIRWLN